MLSSIYKELLKINKKKTSNPLEKWIQGLAGNSLNKYGWLINMRRIEQDAYFLKSGWQKITRLTIQDYSACIQTGTAFLESKVVVTYQKF